MHVENFTGNGNEVPRESQLVQFYVGSISVVSVSRVRFERSSFGEQAQALFP